MRGAKKYLLLIILIVIGPVMACSDDDHPTPPKDSGPHDAPLIHDSAPGESPPPHDTTSNDLTSPPPTTTCTSEGGTAKVQKPVCVKNIHYTDTSWFASPAIVDLDGDGKSELVGAFEDLYVWDTNGSLIVTAEKGSGDLLTGRIYTGAIIADLDGDGVKEIVVGAGKGVAAYEYKNRTLTMKSGWPVLANHSGESYQVRGLAGADLDGDGSIEIIATTTADPQGAQVWVFDAHGKLYQPKGLTAWKAWPRFNKLTGQGNDADVNGSGHHASGCYGLNVAIGNIDDDKEMEILVTYDSHLINAFEHDGRSKMASSWFTNPDSSHLGKPLDWGQFIRWEDPTIEKNHYHDHKGSWPDPAKGQVWLNWTQSPPVIADLDGDGHNEIVAISNAESGNPVTTQHETFMVLEGAYGQADRSARRLAGWETLPTTQKPQAHPSGYSPQISVPAPTLVDLDGDKLPEIIAPSMDGHLYAVSPKAKVLWVYDFRHASALTYASEVAAADLNKDGVVELIFTTWGKSTEANAGRLIILDTQGKLLYDIQVPEQGDDDNGIGLPAAPGIGDLDGDGDLEIAIQSFDHGLDIYTVPGSGIRCLPWPTGRGNLLRNGQGPAYVP